MGESQKQDHGLSGLVVLPTRELAQQVYKHLEAVLRPTVAKRNVALLVGGLALEKQLRILNAASTRGGAAIGTPGRVAQLLGVASGNSAGQGNDNKSS